MKTIDLIDKAKDNLSLKNDFALAKWLETSTGAMSNYREGTRTMDDYTAAKLAQAAGIEPMAAIALANSEREKCERKRDFWREIVRSYGLTGLAFCIAIGAMQPGETHAKENDGMRIMRNRRRAKKTRPSREGQSAGVPPTVQPAESEPDESRNATLSNVEADGLPLETARRAAVGNETAGGLPAARHRRTGLVRLDVHSWSITTRKDKVQAREPATLPAEHGPLDGIGCGSHAGRENDHTGIHKSWPFSDTRRTQNDRRVSHLPINFTERRSHNRRQQA